MKTQAYFDNIKAVILDEIVKANKSIYVAVAWFTDNDLFQTLYERGKAGVKIHLMLYDDEINNLRGVNSGLLSNCKGLVYKIKKGSANIMHNKFCVIDEDCVINGSYNWSYKAQGNDENITVISGNKELAHQFISEFNNIVSKHFKDENADFGEQLDVGSLVKRLQIIKNLLLLNEWEEITNNINKLTRYFSILEVREIVDDLNGKLLSGAIAKIEAFISDRVKLSIFIDPELEALKLEIRAIEIEISSITDEQDEIEKTIYLFNRHQNLAIGHLLIKILKLREEILKIEKDLNQDSNRNYHDAKKEHEEYRKEHAETVKNKLPKLSEEEKVQIKSDYRQASKLCHPDIVSTEQVQIAKEVFLELKTAYDKNDFKKVREIKEMLLNGELFVPKSKSITEKEKLKAELMYLRNQVKKIISDFLSLKNSELYQHILSIGNWSKYFLKVKEQLDAEISSLEINLKERLRK